MSPDVKAMTAELIRDAGSLVFLQLGEALRMEGQIEAAKKVARTGLERHPELPEAHDLYARILVSGNEPDLASQTWHGLLELDPRHVEAHKGLGFLFYSQGNLDASLDHLELALSVDPTDQSVIQALRAVRNAAEAVTQEYPSRSQPVPAEPPATPPTGTSETSLLFAGFESGDHGILLVDVQGRALAGALKTPEGSDGSTEAAAHLAGVSQEMERTARMLKMGEWKWLVVEATDGNVHLTQPAEDTLLVIVRDRDVPAGRLGLLAENAGAKARAWLDGQRA